MRALFVALTASFATLLCLGAIADAVVHGGYKTDKPATYADWQRRDLTKFVRLLQYEHKKKGHFRTVR